MSGLTGIVGPNGCGKSNVLDAIQWVMGESRPTSMRGGGMEDIIFAGAGTRPAKSYAEVALTLDNSDFSAPEDFNREKRIEIVRRVARDLGSNFKINGKEFRARDVQILFADVSSGSQSNSLVKQGQVTELINAKPRDRRRILEEAAGISGLYQRRHEAELKLNSTELNLSRVSDVIDQLEIQIKALERQARQAKRYKDLGLKIRELEALLSYLKFKEAEEAVGKSNQELSRITGELAKSVALASSASQKRIKSEDDIKPLRTAEASFAGELAKRNAQLSTLDEQEQSSLASIKSKEESIRQLKINEEREESLLKDAVREKQRLEEEKKKLENATIDVGKEEVLRSLVERLELDLRTDEKDLEALGEEFARLQERLNAFDNRESQTKERSEKLRFDLQELKSSLDENIQTRKNVERSLEDTNQEISKAREKFKEISERLQSDELESNKATETVKNLKDKISELEGDQSFLNAECLGLRNSVKENIRSDGQLADRLQIKQEYIKALSSILDEELEYPEIKSDGESGWKLMDSLENEILLPEGIKSFADLIDAPEILRVKLKSIGLVENELGNSLQKSLKMGQVLVSREGNFWRWDGFVKYNQTSKSSPEVNLDRKNKLKISEEKLEAVNSSIHTLSQEYEISNENLLRLSAKKMQSQNDFSKLSNEIDDMILLISKKEAELSNLGEKNKVLKESISIKEKDLELVGEVGNDLPLRETLVSELESVRIGYEGKREKVETLRVEFGEKKTDFDQSNLKRISQEERVAEVAIEYGGWVDRLSEAEGRKVELIKREENLVKELLDARKKPDEIKDKKRSLIESISEIKKTHADASNKLYEAEQNLKFCFDQEKNLEGEVSNQREKRATIEANSQNIKDKLRQMEAEIDENLGLTPDKLREQIGSNFDTLPSIEAIEEDIFSLKRKRESLGAVNLRADEDSTELLDQFSSLKVERDDLSGALSKLSSGIADLNKEGRERLKNAFEEVNANFKVLFKDLFGGGEAMLTLVESADPLEAGLEIFCQPPGKKLAAISLLSGGEQTLTALSLIFAVFMANPSPICILDEVDAPLDDSNTVKFCDLLAEMVKKTDTKFLVVTHNAITMSKMNRLMGVTMVEKGVSQLVSVSLKDAEEMVLNNS